MTDERGVRELFVWYRVEPARAPEATAAVQAMQRALVARWPRLQARLLVRRDGDAETWMETYATSSSSGDVAAVADELEAAIAAAATAVQPLIAGNRHVEAFEVVPRA